MNQLVYKYFQEEEHFEEALFLSEHPEKDWESLLKIAPDLPRPWFELSRLTAEDRIEFSREFWLKALPYRPSMHRAILEFFRKLDDVGIVLSLDGRWTSRLIYSFKDNSCFFQGLPPATSNRLMALEKEFDFLFPKDWMAFMKIHNGFGKLLELGVLRVEEMSDARRRVMQMVLEAKHPIMSKGHIIDARALVPFYEAFGLNSFQCFFSDWYPEGEMGNVYFSGIDYTISDTSYGEVRESVGSFPNFLVWLISFLEGMDIIL